MSMCKANSLVSFLYKVLSIATYNLFVADYVWCPSLQKFIGAYAHARAAQKVRFLTYRLKNR
jgi:hypothetical protein